MGQQEIYDEIAYVYDGSLEGLLTSIYESYRCHEKPADVVSQSLLQPRLSQRVINIVTDIDIAWRVRKGIIKKGGWSAFNAIRKASCSSQANAGSIAFIFARYVMDEHTGKRRPFSNISHPSVAPIFNLCRSIDNECEHMRQFIRFRHLKGPSGTDRSKTLPSPHASKDSMASASPKPDQYNKNTQPNDNTSLISFEDDYDIWFARCNPRDSVIPLIMDHFVERFNIQPFIIHDEAHDICGVYDGEGWYLVKTDRGGFDLKVPDQSSDESTMQDAWRRFYNAVSIDSRYHPELRRHFMPKRLWRNITEVQGD